MSWARILLVVTLAYVTAGCGAIRFQRAWSRYQPPADPTGSGDAPAGLEGRWKGEWRSEWNGHSGGLRCLMTRLDDGRYRAWFLSTYARILSFQHETEFLVTAEEGGTLGFEGQRDLGQAIGGVYRYQGTVAGDEFRATFQAENGDHGVFEMRRVDRAGEQGR
jgi:hypothetical protein